MPVVAGELRTVLTGTLWNVLPRVALVSRMGREIEAVGADKADENSSCCRSLFSLLRHPVLFCMSVSTTLIHYFRSACPPVRLSACPPVRLSACPPVRLSACPPLRLPPLPHLPPSS